jgi:glycosyltransferase involved in cell wall biosynthesis
LAAAREKVFYRLHGDRRECVLLAPSLLAGRNLLHQGFRETVPADGRVRAAPRVSVVMPVYNGERFVGQAVESILRQSLTDFELIVVDDASSDRTPEILTEFKHADDRIRVHRNVVNLKSAGAMNIGCKMACGEFVARMDADDISLPHRLQTQLAVIRSRTDLGAVGAGVQIIGENGRKGRICWYPSDPAQAAWLMLFSNTIANPASMARRTVLERLGWFCEGHGGGTEDYALFMAMTRIARIANIPEVLLLYRVWGGNMTHSAWQSQEDGASKILRDSVRDWWSVHLTHQQALLLRGLPRNDYPRSGSAVEEAGKLIQQLLLAFSTDGRFSNRERAGVRRDAGSKLWLLAALALRDAPRVAGTLAISATRTSLTSAFRFSAKVVTRLAGR